MVVQIKKKFKLLWNTFVTSMGFYADAYDLFVISIVLPMLGDLYETKVIYTSLLAASSLFGAIIGQFIFGICGDLVGRRICYITTLVMIISGAIMTSLIQDWLNIFYVYMIIARLFMGIGIGGEYPLSSSISNEINDEGSKRLGTTLTFSMQGLGNLSAPIVSLILLLIIPIKNLDYIWRACLLFGIIPALLVFVPRIFMDMGDQEEKKNKKSRKERMTDFKDHFLKYWKYVLVTGGTWFIFDVTFYANSLFSSTILMILNLNDAKNTRDKFIYDSLFTLIVASIALPGYICSIVLLYLSEKYEKSDNKYLKIFGYIRPKYIQFNGFLWMSVLYLILGIFLDQLVSVPILFLVLYGLTFFFSNFGPNTTTFVIPSELYPSEIKSTCNGISAMMGKMGAVVGSFLIKPIFKAFGLRVCLIICALFALSGMIVTFVFTKDGDNIKNRSMLMDIVHFVKNKIDNIGETDDLEDYDYFVDNGPGYQVIQ